MCYVATRCPGCVAPLCGPPARSALCRADIDNIGSAIAPLAGAARVLRSADAVARAVGGCNQPGASGGAAAVRLSARLFHARVVGQVRAFPRVHVAAHAREDVPHPPPHVGRQPVLRGQAGAVKGADAGVSPQPIGRDLKPARTDAEPFEECETNSAATSADSVRHRTHTYQ